MKPCVSGSREVYRTLSLETPIGLSRWTARCSLRCMSPVHGSAAWVADQHAGKVCHHRGRIFMEDGKHFQTVNISFTSTRRLSASCVLPGNRSRHWLASWLIKRFDHPTVGRWLRVSNWDWQFVDERSADPETLQTPIIISTLWARFTLTHETRLLTLSRMKIAHCARRLGSKL